MKTKRTVQEEKKLQAIFNKKAAENASLEAQKTKRTNQLRNKAKMNGRKHMKKGK